MLSRFAILLLVVTTVPGYSQVVRNMQEAQIGLDQMDRGQYDEALRYFAASINRARHRSEGVGFTRLQEYYARALVEVGALSRAEDALHTAESSDKLRGGDEFAAVGDREMAALLLARGEYDAAERAAATAGKRANAHSAIPIVTSWDRALEALANLRKGNSRRASELAEAALAAVPRAEMKRPYYAPRLLYIVCLVRANEAHYDKASQACRQGLEISNQVRRETRDQVLGYLARAEMQYLAGDPEQAAEAARQTIAMTMRIFGKRHQDLFEAFVLLARIYQRQGKPQDAVVMARDALAVATDLFGSHSIREKEAADLLREAESDLEVLRRRG